MSDGHRDLIWSHLKQFRFITEDEAKRRYGCKRLSARIEELRRIHGDERIKTVIGTDVNRATGRKCRFTDRYELVDQAEIDAPELGF